MMQTDVIVTVILVKGKKHLQKFYLSGYLRKIFIMNLYFFVRLIEKSYIINKQNKRSLDHEINLFCFTQK